MKGEHNIRRKPLIHAEKILFSRQDEADKPEANEANNEPQLPSRLSYRMVFESEEALAKRKLIPDDEVQQLLKERDTDWEKRVKLEQIKSHREGYDKGYSDGSEQASKETRVSTEEEIFRSVEGLKEALMQVEENIRELHKEIEPGITSLIFSIAQQVIGIPVHNEALENQIKLELGKVLHEMDSVQKITIHCSEHDFSNVQRLCADVKLEKVHVQASTELNPGEFQVFTDQRKVIRSFKKSLLELQEKLTIERWGNEELQGD